MTRYTTEVVLQKFRGELTMLDSKGEGQRGGGGESRPAEDFSSDTLDDDIPF